MDPIVPVVFKQAIFWLSFLYFPAAGALLWWIFRQQQGRIAAAFLFVGLSVLAYARFVEPRLLLVASHDVEICGEGLPGTLRAAVVADFHLGIFPNAVSVERVVARLNREDPDLVLIPGDFTLHPKADDLDALFAGFGALNAPAYAVMGNHDVGLSGEDLSKPLTKVLRAHGVTVLNPGHAVFTAKGKYLRIVGQRDLWFSQETGMPLGPKARQQKLATIVLQHNPDTIKEPDAGTFDLMISGHTHGGQIFLPWVTCALTFACDTVRYGYKDSPAGKLFVTSGTGMTGLPMRLGVPPRIDMLNMTIDRCRVKVRDFSRT